MENELTRGDRFPIVSIPRDDLCSMWKIGRGFDGAIRLVRDRMAQDGIDYKMSFRSWFDQDGALCHQNFVPKRGDLQ